MLNSNPIFSLAGGHAEGRKLARVLVGHSSDMKSIKRAAGGYKFEGKEHAGLYKIACCVVCLGPVWRSTQKADTDDWMIDDYTGNIPFDVCSSCEGNLSTMGPLERQVMEDMAGGHAIVLGRALLRMEHFKPNSDTALDILGAAANQ